MKVMVTGGAGFIGSHIVDRLVEAGHAVSVVDNFSTGKRENVNAAASLYNIDIRSERLERVFEKERPDIVSHHAAQIDVRRSISDPTYDVAVNVQGTVNVLECCRKYGVKKIVFASSGGAMYGEPDYLPADESHPVRPSAPYGLAKRVGEQYLDLYGSLYGLESVSLRYANVYGPRQDTNGEAGVIAIFIGKLMDGGQPIIYGDGSQTRDYVYVGDIVDANMAAIANGAVGPINIGTGIATSVNDLYDLTADALNNDSAPIFEPARFGELLCIALDARKAKNELGWSARTNLRQGIAITADSWQTASQGIGVAL